MIWSRVEIMSRLVTLCVSLRLLKAHENLKAQKLSDLRAEVLAGYEQAKRGESRPLDTEAIKAEGRRRLDTLPLED